MQRRAGSRSFRIFALVASLVLISVSAEAQRRRGNGGQPAGGGGQAASTRTNQEAQVTGPAAPTRPRAQAAERSAAPNLPENVEERLYLRDRPDTVGQEARRFQNRMLERLLHARERLVTVRRDEAIRLLDEFVRREAEDAPEMPDALLRLAELRWELARAAYLVAFAEYQRVPEQFRQGHAVPTPDYAIPMRLYDRILERHRGYARYDFVLYMKAYAYVDSDHLDDALLLYQRILTEFPNSRFVPDAHFAMAESAFNGRFDYQAALRDYDHVLEYEDSELFDVALFKSAWCLWRMGNTREAATRFRRVLDLAQNRSGLTSAQRRRIQELQEEALNYLIQVFTEDEQNTAQDVFRFLNEIGGQRYAVRVLERLSEAFYDQARYDRGVEAYKLLLQLDPNSARAPDFQRAIASGYASLEDGTHTTEALETLAAQVAEGGAWSRNQTDPEIIARARRNAERAVREQALNYHQVAQRERQAPRFEPAANLYRIYLRYFPDSPAAYDVKFYLAEILFHRLRQNAEAGDMYLAAARQNPRGRWTRDALYNAITAFERVREVEIANCRGGTPNAPPTPAAGPTPPAGGRPGGPGQQVANGAQAAQGQAQQPAQGGPARCGETDNDRKFSQAIDLYVQLFPTDPDLPDILFRQGKLYYDHGVYDPAVRLFGQLLERFPRSEFAAYAGDLIIQSFQRAQDYANIEQWARRLKSSPAFAAADAQQRLNTLILQSVFKIGEQLSERGQHAEAANAFLRAAEEFPNDPRARQAYYNAGIERQRAGDVSGASEAYEQLIERYPGSTEGALGAWTAAQMFESIAQFSDASRFYESYTQHFPRGDKATDALYNAVLLRMTAGDHGQAVENGRNFLRIFPRHESVDDVYFLIGRAHEGAEQWSDAAQTYREYIRRTRNLERKVEALTRLGQVLLRMNEARNADAAFDQAVSIGRRNASQVGDGIYYAAQARYLQGDRVLAEYEQVSIAGDVPGLRARLQRKSDLLRRAATIYADVVEFRVAEWVTAALYQIGHSYEVFAESMRGAPVPEGLNEEETQVYQDQLQGFIVPIEERALEAYEGGYQKAIELRIFNRWTAKLREALTRLNDVQYPPLREIAGDIVEGNPLPLPQPFDGMRREVPRARTRNAPGTPGTIGTGAAGAASGGVAPNPFDAPPQSAGRGEQNAPAGGGGR